MDKFKILNLKFKIKSGFTFIEFLVYIGILTIILTIFINMFSTIADFRLEAEATSNVQQDGNYLLNKFIYDISHAQSINIPSYSSLGFPTDTLQLTIDGINYTYGVDASKHLIRSGNDGDNQLNGYDTTISNLRFTRFGQEDKYIYDILKVSFTVNSVAKKTSGYETQLFETTVGLREK